MDSSAQSASVFGKDNIVVQASGSGVNVNIGAQPYLRLTQYERRTKLAAKDNSEAALLSAYRADVVALIGREGAIADLRAWLDAEAAVSIRVVVGSGGRGKTRLALELARQIAKGGWLAGFATAEELDRFRRDGGTDRWRWDKPVLIILDYAASRADQLRAWIRELVDASVEGKPKLRLLLLERQANRAVGWLATVFGQGDNDDSRAAVDLLDPKEPVELPALDEIEYRRQVFGALLKRADGALNAPERGVDAKFDRLLSDSKWAGDPLYLMMAGLAAGQSGALDALTRSRADLALPVARNELERIGRIGASRGIDELHNFPGAFVRHMSVIVTLAQGLTRQEARRLADMERKATNSSAPLDGTIEALSDALPPQEETDGIAPIQPDIVGEAAVLVWLGKEGGIRRAGLVPEETIYAVAEFRLSKVCEMLVRTAQDFAASGPRNATEWLESLAQRRDDDLTGIIQIAVTMRDDIPDLQRLADRLYARIARDLPGSTPIKASSPRQSRAFSLNVPSTVIQGTELRPEHYVDFDEYIRKPEAKFLFQPEGAKLDPNLVPLRIFANDLGRIIISIDELTS